MGRFVCLYLSNSLTQEEWAPVYEEALSLAKDLRLTETRHVYIRNVYTRCMAPCEERKYDSGWHDEPVIGFSFDSEERSRSGCETFFTRKYLNDPKNSDPAACDPMYPNVRYCLGDRSNRRDSVRRCIWGEKSGFGIIHILIVALGCLIADRLKDKAYLTGDIEPDDFVTGTDIANRYLEHPIKVPDQCVKEALLERLRKMGLSPHEQLMVFMEMYMGCFNRDVGEFIRSVFSEEECDSFWRQRFADAEIPSFDFSDALHPYLRMQFDFRKLISYVNFIDDHGKPRHSEFIRELLDTKAELPGPDEACIPFLQRTDPSDPAIKLAQHLLKKDSWSWVGICISVDTFIEILEDTIGRDCDVYGIIEEWMKDDVEKSDQSDWFEEMKKWRKQYDVFLEYQLPEKFRKGCTVRPELIERIRKFAIEWMKFSEDPECTALMQKEPVEICRWLAEYNRCTALTVKNWEKIYDHILSDPEIFRRYYPLTQYRPGRPLNDDLITAMVTNDDFYHEAITQCRDLNQIEE